MTESMRKAIGETERRRARQVAHNEAHGITPRSIVKQVRDLIDGVYSEKARQGAGEARTASAAKVEDMSEKDIATRDQAAREKQVLEHARNLEFGKGGPGARPTGAAARAGFRRVGTTTSSSRRRWRSRLTHRLRTRHRFTTSKSEEPSAILERNTSTTEKLRDEGPDSQ